MHRWTLGMLSVTALTMTISTSAIAQPLDVPAKSNTSGLDGVNQHGRSSDNHLGRFRGAGATVSRRSFGHAVRRHGEAGRSGHMPDDDGLEALVADVGGHVSSPKAP